MTENASSNPESPRPVQDDPTKSAPDRPPVDETTAPGALRTRVVEALTGTAMDTIAALPAASRLRFMAFLQLFERPEAVRVDLVSETTGALRLTLTQPPQA